MDTKTWTVVQFIDDLTVEAIPSTWIQGNDWHWPPFSREKLYNAIRKSEPLNTCWLMHKIKIFRSATYGDYLKARNKARVAESTSDINSEPDIESKRKRTPKILSSSDDSEDDSSLPPPPQISKFKQMHIRPGNGVHQATEKVLENINDENLKPEEVDGSSIDNEVQLLQDKSSICKNCRCKDCLEKDRAQKNLMQQYHILRGITSEILQEVRSMKESLNRIEPTPGDAATTSFFKILEFQFPINLEEDLTMFNQFLEKEENFKNAVKYFFSYCLVLVFVPGTTFCETIVTTRDYFSQGLKADVLYRKKAVHCNPYNDA
ncbi:hypothetical protein FQA39_LY05691 [Lamprigera yunnana]|nr:hypothetical protein FQA39_LY05691 [Lamprigera yunnana]